MPASAGRWSSAPRRTTDLDLVQDSYKLAGMAGSPLRSLVLGIDSSTQSTKAVLVDAADGTVVDAASRRAPAGHRRSTRAPGSGALDEAAGPLLERADAVAVGGPAARHGRARRRRRARARRAAVERRPQRRRGRRAGRGARRPRSLRRADRERASTRRTRSPSCAGCATTSPRPWPGSTTCCCRTTTLTWHLAGRGDRADHRPRRRLRHRLLVTGRRRLAARPAQAVPRPGGPAAAHRRRTRGGRRERRGPGRARHRRQHGRGARAGPAARATSRSRSARRASPRW